MRLIIIRHGESEADLLGVHEGRADYPLTERGLRQADAMSRYVCRAYNMDRIYSSPLKRALQTAEYLSAETGLPITSDDRLTEFDNGLIAGIDKAVAAEKYPQIKTSPHSSVYGQESRLEFRYRAEFILSKIISENPEDSTVAAVTHGGLINQLYGAFLRLPVDTDTVFLSGDTAIHEWLVRNGKRTVVMSNHIPHSL